MSAVSDKPDQTGVHRPDDEAQFLYATFGAIPDFDSDAVWDEAEPKIRRAYPWLLDEGLRIGFLGVGDGWRGFRRRGRVTAYAWVPATGILAIDAGLIYLAHFFAACVRSIKREWVVVLASNPVPGFGVALAKALFPHRIPLIVRVQNYSGSNALRLRQSRWQHWLLHRMERFVVRQGDLIITGNDATTKLALSHGVNPERIITMPWPVSWADAAEVTDLPARPTVLHAGRLEKEKGVYLLIEAMKLVTREFADAMLLVAGGGSQRRGMEEMVSKLGIEANVSFLGWLKPQELIAIYKRSTVLVLPSIYEEALGMVLVEAGLMGRPVVCSGTGGMGEVVKHGENGLIVPRGNTEALAEAILEMFRDPEKAKQMGLAGRKIAAGFLAGRERAVERVRDAALELAGARFR